MRCVRNCAPTRSLWYAMLPHALTVPIAGVRKSARTRSLCPLQACSMVPARAHCGHSTRAQQCSHALTVCTPESGAPHLPLSLSVVPRYQILLSDLPIVFFKKFFLYEYNHIIPDSPQPPGTDLKKFVTSCGSWQFTVHCGWMVG